MPVGIWTRHERFQFTRPRGARPTALPFLPCNRLFQFTRPRGARPLRVLQVVSKGQFQFTRPRGARRGDCLGFRVLRTFQFTRPRGARHFRLVRLVPAGSVSIHAPARGATPVMDSVADAAIVSIHAPARGATPTRTESVFSMEFQFTRPRGARRTRAPAIRVPACVSIHAPARGATIQRRRRKRLPRRFNSRAREGRDALLDRRRPGRRGFNSRAREGRDVRRAELLHHVAEFQFTRPRGARPESPQPGVIRCVSIHAPARGATT